VNLNRITPAAVVIALTVGATPAFADSRGHERDDHGRARAEAARPQERGSSEARAVPRAGPREGNAREGNERRDYQRRDDVRRNDGRRDDARREDGRRDDGRWRDGRREYDRRDYDHRDYDRRYYRPYYGYEPRVYVPRPYRPGFSLGFGIFFGHPFPYRYGYLAPPYGYSVGVAYGGVSFGITPGDAAVYVDGNYVGIAATFGGAAQPLALTAGPHRIELQAPGYVPTVFDVNILPGQIIPYQGSLEPGY
jgi:hypothetical protein